MRLARVDYKPIDFEHHGNVFAGRHGVQTDIQDFMAGVSYQIDKVGIIIFKYTLKKLLYRHLATVLLFP